ncbi:hypothetical protein DSO57_1004712 [Entomophthora muscae]|uniref:Uncharacterized protein n=1 Tax=Entomophthora muscae TaxID=34485 RepID=A0ACC2SXC0_9FUNG|nr:hypothetical protein DSO57_1004712 [Entomophthora muscae]
MRGGFKKYLCKYSEFVKELRVKSLDANMIDLLSACKNTTRLFINLDDISPKAALILGEKFPRLSYLEINCTDSVKLIYMSPLTSKVQTLYYHFNARNNLAKFMNYYRDYDYPLVTHLIIEEQLARIGYNFSRIIKRFPALKTLDYTGPYINGYQFNHFFYDIENMVFKEINLSDRVSPLSALICFHDDIPSKTPLLSSEQEVTHESQFRALRNIGIYKFFELIPQITCLDAIDVTSRFLEQEKFVELLLSLKDIRSLSFDFGYHDFSPDLYKETFKATTVFLEVNKSNLTLVLEWLANCFPSLEELGIYLSDGPANYDETKSEFKSTFEFWEKLVESRPNLSKIHLPNDVFSRCQIEKKYPHILVGNKCKARYYDTKNIF